VRVGVTENLLETLIANAGSRKPTKALDSATPGVNPVRVKPTRPRHGDIAVANAARPLGGCSSGEKEQRTGTIAGSVFDERIPLADVV
jgi:hypothetical protein